MEFPLSALAILAGVVVLSSVGVGSASANDGYSVRRATAHPSQLWDTETAWMDAQRIDWGDAPWPTAFRALATADALWLRFDATDDLPWFTMTGRDDKLWEEEVVEIFIDPDGDQRNYVEVEVNPANALCDLMVASAYPRLDADIDWDFPGVETRVKDLQDGGVVVGWTALVRLPWAGFSSVPGTDVALPPHSGDSWTFNVFRIKRPGGPSDPERDLVLNAWSPVPANSFHVPEVFRTMEFE
ncbi:MAG: hypothetical protein GKS06_19070 [Acidobacteria bacterium]|nr:hypothetical protein [Acidobacteriota bacterium]